MRSDAVTTDRILQFVFAFQLVPKRSIRSLGFSYAYSGKIIVNCINRELLTLQRSHGENLLRITDKGIQYLESLQGLTYPEYLTLALKRHTVATNDRIRQVKLAWVMAMINHLIPEFAEEYTDIEKEFSPNNLNSFSRESEDLESCSNDACIQATTSRGPTPEKISELIKIRKGKSQTGNWCLLMREMRMLDGNGLKKLSMIRSLGVLHLPTGNYALYNSMSHRMKLSADYERKFVYYMSNLLHDQELSLIVFAKSYKVALETIRSPEKYRSKFLLGSSLYKSQFYVPLVNGGAKQLDIYTIPHFRDLSREAIVSNESIKRAKNFIYDGETEDKDVIFLGFECELKEIQSIYDICFSVRLASKIIIYCFSWQAKFYYDLFGSRSDIKVVDTDKLIKFVIGKQSKI